MLDAVLQVEKVAPFQQMTARVIRELIRLLSQMAQRH